MYKSFHCISTKIHNHYVSKKTTRLSDSQHWLSSGGPGFNSQYPHGCSLQFQGDLLTTLFWPLQAQDWWHMVYMKATPASQYMSNKRNTNKEGRF